MSVELSASNSGIAGDVQESNNPLQIPANDPIKEVEMLFLIC